MVRLNYIISFKASISLMVAFVERFEFRLLKFEDFTWLFVVLLFNDVFLFEDRAAIAKSGTVKS